ncbi:MAG: septum formation initiator family protein [Leptospira sp.]|nr:septum formation initiator family protein [Leptospira sp.]
MNPLKASLAIAYICSVFYCVVLSTSGLAERRLLELKFQQISEEVERLSVENLVLEEREKLLQNDAYALEKEARKYYLLSENAHVIKFVDEKSKLTSEFQKLPKTADLRINLSLKEPPLFLLRFFYLAFSVFLCVGVYFKLKSLPPTSKPKRLN